MSDQTVQTYGNDPAFKAAFLGEIAQHEQADALIKGDYGKMNGHFKGCAIGCSVFSLYRLQGKTAKEAGAAPRDHAKVARDLGWPLWLAYVEDTVFERLPDDLSKTWPRRLAEAIPVGAVITDDVLAKILVWSLTAETFGVIHATDSAEIKGWITTIADYITADAAGTVTADQREAAARAARAARAAWAAWDAWDVRDVRDVRAAWDAWAAWDVRDARDVRDAWAAWDVRDARDAFYPALAEYVLKVLSKLPVTTAA